MGNQKPEIKSGKRYKIILRQVTKENIFRLETVCFTWTRMRRAVTFSYPHSEHYFHRRQHPREISLSTPLQICLVQLAPNCTSEIRKCHFALGCPCFASGWYDCTNTPLLPFPSSGEILVPKRRLAEQLGVWKTLLLKVLLTMTFLNRRGHHCIYLLSKRKYYNSNWMLLKKPSAPGVPAPPVQCTCLWPICASWDFGISSGQRSYQSNIKLRIWLW